MADTLTDDKLDWTRSFTGVEVTGAARGTTAQPSLAFRDDEAPGGPPPQPPPPGGPPANPAVEKAKTDIGSRHAVKVGSEGNATWQASELTAVSDALNAIPAADKDALKGVEINRVSSFGTSHHTMADYETGVSSEGQAATETRKVLVGDETFVDRSSGRPVPVTPAEQTRAVVHEIGHVVAKNTQVEADFADAKAVVSLNGKIEDLKKITDEIADLDAKLADERPKSNELWNRHPKGADLQRLNEMDKAIKQKEDRIKVLHGNADTLRREIGGAQQARETTKAAAAATRVPEATVQAGQQQLEAAGVAAAGASWKAATASTHLNQNDLKDSQAYRVASDAVERELAVAAGAVRDDKVGSGKDQQPPDDLDDKLSAFVAARDAARKRLAASSPHNPALTAYEAIDRAQNDWFTKLSTQARLRDRTPKIQEFVGIVEHDHIKPMTPYALQSWPAKPEEFFAEAYSFWRTQPNVLKNVSMTLFNWFESGNYR